MPPMEAVPAPERPRSFSIAGLPEEHRVERWEGHNTSALVGLRCRAADSPLRAEQTYGTVGQVRIARVAGSPHEVERSRRLIDATPTDAVAAYFPLRGRAQFRWASGSAALSPGSVLVCNADQPFQRSFRDGLEELAVLVPRSLLTGVDSARSLARPVLGDVGAAGSAGRTTARLLARALRSSSPVAADERTLVELVSVLVCGDRVDVSLAHRARARAFIEERLRDPALDAGAIAAAVGLSERHLGRVFADDGTSIPRHVLRRRLDVAHSVLTDPDADHLSIADVAARCGFSSSTYFSHTFRQRFGVRAGDVRRASRPLRAG